MHHVHPPTGGRLRGTLAVMLVLALLSAACGHRLTEEEVLAASGVLVVDDGSSGGAVAPAQTGGGTAPAGPTATSTTTGGGTAGGGTTAAGGTAPGGTTTPGGGSTTGQAAATSGGTEAAASPPGASGASGAAGASGDGQGDGAAPAGDAAAGDVGTDPGPPAAGGGGATAATCTTTDTGPVVVGNVGSYSGLAGGNTPGMATGVRVWAAQLNSQGGLCGREVQVLVQDDGGDPARYGALIRDMVEGQGIVSFVGNAGLVSLAGGLDYHVSSGVPVIGNDCAHADWYGPVGHFAPACARPVDVITGTLVQGIALGGSSAFGYVFCTEAQVCRDVDISLRETSMAAAGADLRYSAEVSAAQVDYTAECQSARDAGVEVLWVVADAASISRMTRSCVRQGYTPQQLGVSLTVGPETVTEEGLEDLVVATGIFPFQGASTPAIDAFTQGMATFAPGERTSPAHALGYTNGKLFEAVAVRAAEASGTITPESLTAALHTLQGETLGGLSVPLTFTANGPDPARCYFVIQGDGTGNGFAAPLGPDPVCL